MEWAFKPIDICDGEFRIRSFGPEDIQRLAEALIDPDGYFGKFHGIDTSEKIAAMFADQYAAHLAGTSNPLVFEWQGDVVGATRLFNFNLKRRSLEIGATWIAPRWRRTFVNTKAKYLLMNYLFDSRQFGVERIEFVVCHANTISQMAVLRIGAKHEGVLRHLLTNVEGQTINAHLYSVILPEWPKVERHLLNLLDRKDISYEGSCFSTSLKTDSIHLRPYVLSDAQELFDFVQRNRTMLAASFPGVSAADCLERAEQYVADKAHLWASGSAFFWGIWTNELDPRMIGQVHLKHLNWQLKNADVGYFVDPEFHRQGIASTALGLIFGEAMRQGFVRITARILPDNTASQALAKKIGFLKEGLMRSAYQGTEGRPVDIELWAWARI